MYNFKLFGIYITDNILISDQLMVFGLMGNVLHC